MNQINENIPPNLVNGSTLVEPKENHFFSVILLYFYLVVADI